MAEDGTPKKVSSLLEKEDAANEDLISMWKEAEEVDPMMNMMGTLVSIEPISIEPREYMSQNKITLASKVKAKIKKVTGKILQKAKPRKKRTTLDPIVGAVLKFHKDDDVDPADAGTACRS